MPLLDPSSTDGARQYALAKATPRLDWVAERMQQRETVLDSFSVADAYLFTALNWAQVTPIRLGEWPALTAYMKKLLDRPRLARAFAEERELYARRA